MTRHPFDSGELGRNDPDMDLVGAQLERYALELTGDPPMDLAARVQVALDDEPSPARGWWASLLASFGAWHAPARLVMASTVLAAAALGVLVLGDLVDRARNNIGSSPVPSVIEVPTSSPTATPTPTPTPSPSPTPAPTLSAPPTASGTPAPTGSDELDTPEPSETDDNSGSGGGED